MYTCGVSLVFGRMWRPDSCLQARPSSGRWQTPTESMQFGALWLAEWAAALRPANNPAQSYEKPLGQVSKGNVAPESPGKDAATANGTVAKDPVPVALPKQVPNGVHASPVSTASSSAASIQLASVTTVPVVSTVPDTPAAPSVKLTWAERVAANTPRTKAPVPPASTATPSPPLPVRSAPLPPLPDRRVRGLVNGGNTCFINVILQALIACNPFRRFLLGCRDLKTNPALLDKFVALAVDMTVRAVDAPKPLNSFTQEVKSSRKVPNLDEPLLVDWSHDIFPSSLPNSASSNRPVANGGKAKGRRGGSQEDAEEFLIFLLNKLHEDLLASENHHADVKPNGFVIGGAHDLNPSAIRKSMGGIHAVGDDDGGWTEMNRKGRPVQIRDSVVSPTAITKIFGGIFRSELRRQRGKASVSREPFLSMGLDIDSGMIRHVEDALAAYFKMEHVEGLTLENSGETVDGKKQVLLETLPPVLILHLKRFSRNSRTGALNKVSRHLDFPEELSIAPSIFYGSKTSAGQSDRMYRLTAVVTHIGKELAGGHYVCDVRIEEGPKQLWATCDDSKVSLINRQNVLRRHAYILFYTRSSVGA